MSVESKYKNTSTASLRRIILDRNVNSDEAAFYLLRYRMFPQFSSLYRQYNIKDELGDVLMDFYMYLRNSKRGSQEKPFLAIEGLRSWWAFEPWLVKSFKHFLQAIINKEVPTCSTDNLGSEASYNEYSGEKLDREIQLMGKLIGWVNEDFAGLDKFIFFRSLLFSLDKKKVIERDRMAEALGLTDVNYRTKDSRLRKKAKEILGNMQNGKYYNLNEQGKEIASDIELNYENFFSIISKLYESTLTELHAKEAVESLRLKDLEEQRAKAKKEEEKLANKAKSNASTNKSVEDNDEPDIRFSLRSDYPSSHNEDLLKRIENASSKLPPIPPSVLKEWVSNSVMRPTSRPNGQSTHTQVVPKSNVQHTVQTRPTFKPDFSELNKRKKFIKTFNAYLDEVK